MNKLSSKIWLFALVLALFSLNSSAAELSATAQVKSTVDEILSVLKEKTADTQNRRDKIRELINSRFYFRAMSQSALSRNWKKASPEQQAEFVKLFSQLLENTYIGRIEAYTDEKVEYLREKNKSPTRSVVYTQILTQSADIPIYYKMAKKNDQWLVYDVVIEEVSLISNYRTSYAEIIKNEGMDGLLKRMKEKVKETAAPVKPAAPSNISLIPTS